jgi:hypothetical protein
MNSHWLSGYGDPPPDTVIVVGMHRDFSKHRRRCSWEGCENRNDDPELA